MWCLGGWGGGVLKGIPLLNCRVTPRLALPSPAGKGSRRLGALGAGPLPAFGIQPCSLGLAREAMGPGLRDFAVKHAPPLQVSSVWENGTFLEGWDSVPGDCTFISDSRLSETDGSLGAWF